MELWPGLCARAVTSTTRERRRVAPKGDSLHEARHFGLHDLRTDLRSYLADRADLGDSTDDMDGSGDGAAIGTVLWSQQDFIFSQCTPTTGSQLQLLSGTTFEFE